MAFRDRIEVIVDFVTDPAKKGLGQLKTDVAAADGVMGKAKVAATGLGSALSAYAGPAALAGAAAFVEFGRRSVTAFQETALAAGQFSDATGIGVEDASRWIEVSDSIGVATEAVQGAFLRMNKAVASGAFEKYGIEVKRAADGTVDANATFQAAVTTIGAIPDATQRAKVATEVFGRGYASISRLMEMDAKSLADALGSVTDGQIITEEEKQKARDFQEAMDNLKDSTGELMLALGEGLVPALTDVANVAADTIGPLVKLNEVTDSLLVKGPFRWAFDKIKDGWDKYGKAVLNAGDAQDKYNLTAEEAAARIEYAQSRVEGLTYAQEQAARSTEFSAQSMDRAKDSADRLRDALSKTYGEVLNIADGKRGFVEAMDTFEQAMADLDETMGDSASTAEDVDDATRKAGDAAIDAAKSYATMEGASLDSKEGHDRLIDALGWLSSGLDPNSALRKNIDTYTWDLLQIPTDVKTQVRVEYVGNGLVVDENGNVCLPVGTKNAPAPPVTTTDAQGRSASGGKPAVMSANSLWQRAMSAWGSRGGKDRLTEEEKKARKEQNDFERDMKHARKKYEVGDYSAQRYFNVLVAIQEKYGWNRLSDNWMMIWREMDTALGEIAQAAEELQQQADSAGGSSSGGSSSAGSMSSGGSGGATIALDGGRRITNINIHLKGLFVGTEAEMRKAVRPLVPAISRELDRYEKG